MELAIKILLTVAIIELCRVLFYSLTVHWFELWLNTCLFFLLLAYISVIVYSIVLYECGLLANKTPYAVCLEGCFLKIVDDIVRLASREEICDLRQHMYQRGILTRSMYEELLDKSGGLTNGEQMNKIIQDALRGESKMRVVQALADSFEEMATDRNRCHEIAELIKIHTTKWEMLRKWAKKLLYLLKRQIQRHGVTRFAWGLVKGVTPLNVLCFLFRHFWSGAMVYPRGEVKAQLVERIARQIISRVTEH